MIHLLLKLLPGVYGIPLIHTQVGSVADGARVKLDALTACGSLLLQ